MMVHDVGRVPSEPGSRKPSPDGLGPSGFDPSREEQKAPELYDPLAEIAERVRIEAAKVRDELTLFREVLATVIVNAERAAPGTERETLDALSYVARMAARGVRPFQAIADWENLR